MSRFNVFTSDHGVGPVDHVHSVLDSLTVPGEFHDPVRTVSDFPHHGLSLEDTLVTPR